MMKRRRVIPAKAGTSWRSAVRSLPSLYSGRGTYSARLHETAAFAGART